MTSEVQASREMQALAKNTEVTLFGFEGAEALKLVLIVTRVHPFPFRTRKLSSFTPKILAWRRAGKIGNANTKETVERLSLFSSQNILFAKNEDCSGSPCFSLWIRKAGMWKSPCKSRVFWEVDPPEDKKCGKISKKLKIRG